ncbi:katanin p80 WD40 repeat-containing subunit B1 homolog KTN80.4-like isoform X2 [Telopea speciosissima]|uniref:katanin p80 WD40 repeat-containing subunit B1 homolog KTN80.4-like isoform X2 n=1 Tax=Telopea speciosissima TaxID=54955 RepID=UPI001CC36B0E|nr:katanin p80 WD40 repeat-containing subunit B1 homolog KTN80.4-like isoform X2 [Telopea speciosissima]
MTTKRAYKLQEFVAHSSSVNCLKIGRKSSRVLVTGGEDHKVNLWAIGKPNAILSLPGHTSAIESVSFDSSEALVAAGAASGTIKLWDLEEAKIVRTLTGHRSNCISVDFHPFGEFFASGSLDTNLKIWDIRRKGCIHTYKGHTRGVNAIRFTPDGRWVVSGGEDNIVKLWDLTAGKLLHDFKCHEGQIQCIDFHPHEFLLATGSADRTVKFWDLETFELIGSAGPETTGVRSMTFNPDGRTLLCGLHESLKIFSWEPIRCHDAVDVGWSKLSDMNIHEGKLLGCSYNQSCVGVWVVDISRIEPYAIASAARSNSHPEPKSTSIVNLSVLTGNNEKISTGRISVIQNSDPVAKETKTLGRLSVSQSSDPMKEAKPLSSTGSIPGIPQRVSVSSVPKTTVSSAVAAPSAATLKRNIAKSPSNHPVFNKSDVIPVIVPRTNVRLEQASDSKKEIAAAERTPFSMQARVTDFRKPSNNRVDQERPNISAHSVSTDYRTTELNEVTDQNFLPAVERSNPAMSTADRDLKDARCPGPGKHGMNLSSEPSADDARVHKVNRDACSADIQKGGKTRSLVASWEKRESFPAYEGPTSSNSSETTAAVNVPFNTRGRPPSAEKETVFASNEDAISDLMEQHEQFVGSMRSRLTKLQVIRRYWERNDVKGAIAAMEKMGDHAVLADVISIFTEKTDMVTLDICTCLLPLLTVLLESNMDRHLGISLEMLLKLVRIYGSVIHSTLSASSSVGVDIQAEQRLERCNLCFIELEKVKHFLPSLVRRGGSIAKSAQELNLALQEVI